MLNRPYVTLQAEIRTLHAAVFCRQFHSMKQQVGEDIRSFLDRLEQYSLGCDFVIDCIHCGQRTSYSGSQQHDRLMTGLANEYIRKEAYARAKTTSCLVGMVYLCTEIEQSGRDMIAMTDPTATEDTLVVNHMKSQYQRRKAQSTTQNNIPDREDSGNGAVRMATASHGKISVHLGETYVRTAWNVGTSRKCAIYRPQSLSKSTLFESVLSRWLVVYNGRTISKPLCLLKMKTKSPGPQPMLRNGPKHQNPTDQMSWPTQEPIYVQQGQPR